jgi:protein tyrosine phosphatase
MNNTLIMPDLTEYQELEEKENRRMEFFSSEFKSHWGERFNKNKRTGLLNMDPTIIPFDVNRVKLKNPIMNDVDYINASEMSKFEEDTYSMVMMNPYLPMERIRFIISHHPLRNTISHHWQMVYEQRVDIMIQIGTKSTKSITELKRSKNDLVFKSIRNVKLNQYLTREEIELKTERRGIHSTKLFHYTGWPDRQVFSEEDVKNLLTAMMKIRREVSSESETLTLLAYDKRGGISGATSVLILYDLLEKIDLAFMAPRPTQPLKGAKNLNTQDRNTIINIYQTVDDVRKKRMKAVQNFAEYEMLFQAVLYYTKNKPEFDEIMLSKDKTVSKSKENADKLSTGGNKNDRIISRVEYAPLYDDICVSTSKPNAENLSSGGNKNDRIISRIEYAPIDEDFCFFNAKQNVANISTGGSKNDHITPRVEFEPIYENI